MEPSKELQDQPEILFDYEMIVSRRVEKIVPLSVPSTRAIPVFFVRDEGAFYVKLDRNDTRFFEIHSEVVSKKFEIIESKDIEWIKYSTKDTFDKFVEYPLRNVMDIPGVIADPFMLKSGNLEYWRFRFIKEALEQVSDYLVKYVNQVNFVFDHSMTNIEYFGVPHSDLWYLQKYNYARKVIAAKIREVDTREYRNNAPHYLYPFHLEHKYFNQRGETHTDIRFSTHVVEARGIIEELKVLRDSNLTITEEKRKSIITSEYTDLGKGVYLAPLWMYQNYDGTTDPVQTWIIDEDDLNTLFERLKNSNEKLEKYAHFVIESVEKFYRPEQKI